MTDVLVRCPCCRGAGRVPLTGEYLETHRVLAAMPAEASGADMGRRMGVPRTAMSNRLAALERMGLATSRRFGRKRMFRAVGGAVARKNHRPGCDAIPGAAERAYSHCTCPEATCHQTPANPKEETTDA